MKRLTEIEVFEPVMSIGDNIAKCRVVKNFDDTSEEILELEEYDLDIDVQDLLKRSAIVRAYLIDNCIVKNIKLPDRHDISKLNDISFVDCIFVNNVDLNFFDFDKDIKFKNCIFIKNFNLYGNFDGVVSFEACTFFDATISFQECSFGHFVFNLTVLKNSTVNFQETYFNSNNVFLGNCKLTNSNFLFNNSFFAKNSDLLDLLGVIADESSKIKFSMVDFNFTEVRIFRADIKYMEFTDCTFECNRFDFECSCETLIMQNCRNFRILSLDRIVNLKHLNLYNTINTGRILIDANANYYIDAIKYGMPQNHELINQLYTLMGLYDLSQLASAKLVEKELELIKKAEDIKNNASESMRIFLSYSWKDEELADSVEAMFNERNIPLVRDKREIQYRGSIKEFMKQVRHVDYVLIIISDNYLKSSNCMYEIAEFTKDDNYKERILPIIKDDANIFTAIDRSRYVYFWQGEYLKLEEEAKRIEEMNRSEIIKELIRLERIKRDLPDFLSNISDMNAIVCKNRLIDLDFEKIWMIVMNEM